MSVSERYLSIMFSDLKSYSKIDSKRIYRLVKACLKKFISDHSGDQNFVFSRLTGDELVICSDSCLYCANIALKFRDYMLSINWKNEDYHQPIIPRIGVHCGQIDVETGTTGKINSIDGRTVIYASRIEPVTIPGMCFCSYNFYNAINQLRESNIKLISKGKINLAKEYGEEELYSMHWYGEFMHPED